MPENLTPVTMTKDECSCLVYVESCCVDYSGMMEAKRMDHRDIDALEKFQSLGLLVYGRSPYGSESFRRGKTHWVTLTREGWALASLCRQLRAEYLDCNRREVNEMLSEKE